MASTISSPLHSFVLILFLVQFAHSAIIPDPKNRTEYKPQPWNTYIVQTNHFLKPSRYPTLQHWYDSVVSTYFPRATDSSPILYRYDTVMHGFAVQLTDDEARRMSSVPGVSAVHKDRVFYTQTTRSPGFLGLNPELGAWPDSNFGDGIIIGFIDTGIWPEHASFNDSELSPVPPRWRGKCADAEGFSASLCNKKLIGAQAFIADAEADGITTPRDKIGHGTHVASTAAGTKVRDAGVFMFARGDATGVAPRARIAMYKACNTKGCKSSSIAAAIDTAVKDGVDIISISLGDDEHRPFYEDVLAIATFGAVRRGVFVTVAGGNNGPRSSTVTNVAPWMTTVGAATVDRVFQGKLILGNGAVLAGESLYPMKVNSSRMTPLVFSSCHPSDLTPDRVMDKVVACMEGAGPKEGILVQQAGGAGIVAVRADERLGDGVPAQAFTLPGLSLGQIDGEKLRRYMESVPYPTASFIFSCDTIIGENRAPIVAGFSSRGPNRVVAEILKPDVIAPGVNILAAWPGPEVDYKIISGTSMACPHVAGVAALIKKKHGDWSSAMLLSAIVTSAWNRDNTEEDILDNVPSVMNAIATPLVSGAGVIRPMAAMHPGLVYDAGVEDYIDFLCTLNYTKEQMQVFAPELAGCTRKLPGGIIGNLNYPSFTVVFDSSTPVRTLTRTVTKVSPRPEVYNVIVVAPDWVKVTVSPTLLEFKRQYEKKSYTVEFRCERGNAKPHQDFGYVIWDNRGEGMRRRQVRSPAVFLWSSAATCVANYCLLLFSIFVAMLVLL